MVCLKYIATADLRRQQKNTLMLSLLICNLVAAAYCSAQFKDELPAECEQSDEDKFAETNATERRLVERQLAEASINLEDCGAAEFRDWQTKQRSYSCARQTRETHNATRQLARNRYSAGYYPKRSEIPSWVRLYPHGTGGQRCSGTIIAHNLVVTAEHCLTSYDDKVSVTVGFQRHTAAKICRASRDIAIIRLKTSFEFGDSVKAACVELYRRPARGSVCLGVGNGMRDKRVSSQGPVRALPLTQVECDKLSKADVRCYESALNYNGGICSGDSGGPVYCFESCKGKTRMFVTGVGCLGGLPCTPGRKTYTAYCDFVNEREKFIRALKECSSD